MVPSLATLLSTTLLLLPTFTSAHYSIEYPYWRGDSFETQLLAPCGGVNQSISNTNRTQWPISGGSLIFTPSHPNALTWVHLALGNVASNFKYELVPVFNQTGIGRFCFPKITVPKEDIEANGDGSKLVVGANASLQIIQYSGDGGALYNCADITFAADEDAPLIGDDECWNNTGIGWADIVSIPMTNAEGEQLPADKTSTGEKVTVTVEVSAARAGLPILWETGVLAAGLVAMGMGMTGLF